MTLLEPAPFPVRVSVEVTNRCNQACRLCPREAFTRGLGLMSRSVFDPVVEEVARHESSLLLHFLGEPLLHPDLPAMIRHAKEAGVNSVALSTNATLLEGDRARALLDSGLDRLDCSVDAVDAHGYLLARGTDDFERAMRNITAFLAARGRTAGASPQLSLQYLEPSAIGPQLDRALEQWEPLLGPDDFVKGIEPANFLGSVGPEPIAPSIERPPCAWLFTSLMVLQDGTVTACGADWDAQAPLGRAPEQTIAEIWSGPDLAERRQAHREHRFGDVALCAECTDWPLADGSGYRNIRPGSQPRPGPVTVHLAARKEATPAPRP